jgi:hypothetical protein
MQLDKNQEVRLTQVRLGNRIALKRLPGKGSSEMRFLQQKKLKRKYFIIVDLYRMDCFRH